MNNAKDTVYSDLGDEFFKNLVEIFYTKVENNEILRFMFPDTLDEAKENLRLFLLKIFGGPDDYTPKRGHPMMRRRHLPFSIGLIERNEWIKLMMESLDELGITKNHPKREVIDNYFQSVATHMMNKKVNIEDF
jgi:hemoglobin